MVIELQTRVLLGSRETPRFVSREFFDAMKHVTAQFQTGDPIYHHDTIHYFVPKHMVVERSVGDNCDNDLYEVSLDDHHLVPRCRRRKRFQKLIFKLKHPRSCFDRMQVSTERVNSCYFLLLPNAAYYNTEIFTNWQQYHLWYNYERWNVHFRQVNVDPHETSETIWFFSQPKFQIEITTNQDFRGRDDDLKKALLAIIPRAFRWESNGVSGGTS
jgi:hypothetical protein